MTFYKTRWGEVISWEKAALHLPLIDSSGSPFVPRVLHQGQQLRSAIRLRLVLVTPSPLMRLQLGSADLDNDGGSARFK